MNGTGSEDILWRHIRELPYFRAMVRAVEDGFYQDLELPRPILDVGCGDGQFASVAFREPLDVGIDPFWATLPEAHHRGSYRLTIQAEGARIPFPDASFASAVSNSVLEHIPDVEPVLAEVARVVKPGGTFLFCVPNHRFPQLLLGTTVMRSLGIRPAADWYGRFFNRISRHVHTDPEPVWRERLSKVGFSILKTWDYFPQKALFIMETGHFFGLPALFSRKLTGRWILSPSRWNLWLPYHLADGYVRNPLSPEGVYSFYVTQRNA
ncbi:MAG TPA: class I SAM-dependent methyltransferase [Anaerolineaceae bacterium]|nr:class I SAM-dependent methyltransferase [Anaerolineaceae bacterium]